MILVRQAPMRLILGNSLVVGFKVIGNKENIRIKPYLPNFRSSPARIIDPATGASTWALGSHRWVK